MRLLLDESIPRPLRRLLLGHRVRTVQEEGWSSLSNGRLLAAASRRGFEVLVTVDRSLPFQQNLEGVEIAVVVLRARSNRLTDLEPAVPALLDALGSIAAGDLVTLEV